MVLKKNWFELTVLTQKSFMKNLHWAQKYLQKKSKNMMVWFGKLNFGTFP